MYPHPAVIIYFYPRPLRGGRRAKAAIEDADEIFLSTPSARRATHELDHGQRAQVISIHALCEEGDSRRWWGSSGHADFYPRPLRGGRLREHQLLGEEPVEDFYPRPLRGGRRCYGLIYNEWFRFLSTPSARRATYYNKLYIISENISIHALCEEGDLLHGREQHHRRRISIHALCEEGDSLLQPQQTTSWYFYPRPLRGGRLDEVDKYPGASKFLSTPSARRATRVITSPRSNQNISIHALCEEGDYKRTAKSAKVRDFYPRPLRGGRPFNEIHKAKLRYISIHALCEEGDQSSSSTSKICSYFYPRPLRGGRRFDQQTGKELTQFLSTPSARRATLHRSTARTSERYFYPRPLRGGRRTAWMEQGKAEIFLSTPSARRATPTVSLDHRLEAISIHALCEEGDSKNRDKISIFKQIIQHSARI